MKPDVQSETVRVSSESALQQAGKVALTFLEETGQASKNHAVQIFEEFAREAVQKGAVLPYIEFENESLKARLASASSKAASAWMSPLWKQLEKMQDEWGVGLKATAIRLGIAFTPRLQKLPGSRVRYRLDADPFDLAAEDLQQAPTPDGGLRYTPAAVAAPGALLLAGLRNGVMRNTLPIVIGMGIIAMLVLIFIVASGWWIFAQGLRWNAPLTTAHISILAVWGFAAWTGVRLFKFLAELADLGIVMAPDLLVPFKSDHVTLELRPSPDISRM